MSGINRTEILESANKIITGKRETDYGTPEDNFQAIADLWGTYLCIALRPEDVAAMMILLKVGRMAVGGGSPDTWVDIAGYAACGGEIFSRHADTASVEAKEVERFCVGESDEGWRNAVD